MFYKAASAPSEVSILGQHTNICTFDSHIQLIVQAGWCVYRDGMQEFMSYYKEAYIDQVSTTCTVYQCVLLYVQLSTGIGRVRFPTCHGHGS